VWYLDEVKGRKQEADPLPQNDLNALPPVPNALSLRLVSSLNVLRKGAEPSVYLPIPHIGIYQQDQQGEKREIFAMIEWIRPWVRFMSLIR